MRSSELPRAACVALWIAGISGCFEPLEHEGRSCPCASGFVCDDATMRCVAADRDAAATRDASLDAAVTDAAVIEALDAPSPMDAPSVPDALAMDAVSPADAGAADAPGLDAWAADARTFDAFPADAFAPDALAPDAFSPDAGSVPCPTGILLCDDFESMEADRVPPWGYADGAAARSTELAFRGAASGRFAVAAADATQSVGRTLTLPADVWVRARLLVRGRAMGTARRDVAFFHFGDDTAPGYDNVSVTFADEMSGLVVGTYNTASSTYRPGRPIASDAWTCISAHVRPGPMGLIELYVGGTLAYSVVDDVSFAGGGIRVVDVGITYSGETMSPVTLHLDDVAVSTTTPLPCD